MTNDDVYKIVNEEMTRHEWGSIEPDNEHYHVTERTIAGHRLMFLTRKQIVLGCMYGFSVDAETREITWARKYGTR
jgi:hypothetical protein